jgi:hypothetical protein
MHSTYDKSVDTSACGSHQIFGSTCWCPTLLKRTFEVATGTAAHAWQPAVPGDLGPAPRVQICTEPWGHWLTEHECKLGPRAPSVTAPQQPLWQHTAGGARHMTNCEAGRRSGSAVSQPPATGAYHRRLCCAATGWPRNRVTALAPPAPLAAVQARQGQHPFLHGLPAKQEGGRRTLRVAFSVPWNLRAAAQHACLAGSTLAVAPPDSWPICGPHKNTSFTLVRKVGL